MEWALGVAIFLLLVMIVMGRKTESNDRITPRRCSCVWFSDEIGPYIGLSDVNCKTHGRK